MPWAQQNNKRGKRLTRVKVKGEERTALGVGVQRNKTRKGKPSLPSNEYSRRCMSPDMDWESRFLMMGEGRPRSSSSLTMALIFFLRAL